MPTPERLSWQQEVRDRIPAWGTKRPIDFLGSFKQPFFDSNGRPLDEGDDVSMYNPAQVARKLITLTFPDSRNGKLANESAYHEIRRDYAKTLDILAYFRATIPKEEKPTSIDHLSLTLQMGIVFPYWLLLKSDNPMHNGSLPPYFANLSKMSRGLAEPFIDRDMVLIANQYLGENQISDTSFIRSGEDYFTDVNKGFLYAEKTDRACPAPAAMIKHSIDFLLDESFGAALPTVEELSLSNDEIARVQLFAKAYRRLAAAYLAYGRLNMEVSVYQYSNNDVMRPIRERLQQIRIEHVTALNSMQTEASEALLRHRGPKIKVADIPAIPIRLVNASFRENTMNR